MSVPDPPRPVRDSVEDALAEIGDRWTFLIMREAFFGVTRFQDFAARTGASTAVLTDRLTKLLDNALLTRTPYGAHPNRFDYRLTDKGRDLYPVIVLVMQWGDRWLAGDAGPPLTLVHRCGAANPFPLTCGDCGEPIEARTTTWTVGDEA